MEINTKNIRPILKPKKQKVLDPPRYPNVINEYEGQAKKIFAKSVELTLKEIADKMIELKGLDKKQK
jgi:hypothetical protein